MDLIGINSGGTFAATSRPLPEVTRSVIESTVRLYERVGWVKPWIGYLAFENDECVGTCAFTSAPRNDVVEIAYFTFPGHEGLGVATRMAECLVSMASMSAPAVSVTAHTLPQENASTRVLRKSGFVFTGPVIHAQDGPIWVWRYEGKGSLPTHSQDPAPEPGVPPAGQRPHRP